MSKTELIKELREITQAGMKDCADALAEAGNDIQKAVDIIKTKGKNIVSGRSGKVASEGRINITTVGSLRGQVMVEVNCQTDFVANSDEFSYFSTCVAEGIVQATNKGLPFDVNDVEPQRAELVSRTKENIVIRRWWVQETMDPKAFVTSYLHGNKIGVLMTILVSDEKLFLKQELTSFAEGLAMQVAAMNPVAVSPSDLPADVVDRQRSIFETQLREANKPESAWPKILEGKFNKWYTEVCLMNQESIMLPKKTVKQYLDEMSPRFGGEITVVNFIRCQVGEGIDKPKEDFADEVAKLV